MDLSNLAIIAGEGHLPKELSEIYHQYKGNCLVIKLNTPPAKSLGLSGPIFDHYFNIGQVGTIIKYLKQNLIKNIIFAGNISRPDLFSLKLDLTGSILLGSILKNKLLGDDKLLSIIITFMEDKGFKVISPLEIIALHDYDFSTATKPSGRCVNDIEVGIRICNAIGELDIGQAIIIEDGYVLGVEAAEGTDNLLERCAILRKKKSGGILIKLIKNNQDTRIDLPTIGPKTIELLHKYQYNGMVISKNKVIILSPAETFKQADNYGLFIHLI